MRRFIGFLLCIPFLCWAGVRIYRDITFGINCEGHLKRAADSNTIELAIQEMSIAVSYLEKEDITGGYTSILYKTPDADVGFWYSNLKSSLDELEKVKPEATQLERSNILLKLRETLLDHESSGDSVTVPGGISVFPNNSGFCLFSVITGIVGLVGLCLLFLE